MKVAVLLGGDSEERDVSLSSGVQVARALRAAGHEVVAVDPIAGLLPPSEETRILETGVGRAAPDHLDKHAAGTALATMPELRDVDVLFVALHGGAGEDGTLQGLLDMGGFTYTGSGRLGCAVSMDKDVSKRLLRDAGVPTPDWITGITDPRAVVDRLGLPVVVKPVSGGSTVGLTLVKEAGLVEPAAELASRFGVVMYEAFVPGRELTVGILGDQVLPVGEIIPEHEIFDYECKYQPGMAEEIFPADLPPALAEKLQELALRAHRALRLHDYSRVDFMLDGDGNAWCLEANALPGMTANSLLPKAARAAGIDFPDLCDRIVQLAAKRRTGP